MTSYLIIYKEGYISIYEYNEEFEILKYNGEEKQKFEFSQFWEWWREKVEYTNQKISFVVLTDKEEFKLPDFISLSDEIVFLEEDLSNFLDVSLKVLTFPKIDFSPKVKQKARPIPKKGTLEDYFYKKLKQYKGR